MLSETSLEKRRLLQLHEKSLFQRVVENRISGRIVEIRQNNGVLLGEGRRRPQRTEIEPCPNDRDQNRSGRNQNLPEPPARSTNFRDLHSRR